MLELSAEAKDVVTRSYTMRVRAQSWLGDELLTDDIPVAAGSETVDASLQVPETVSLTIPREDRGTLWDPLDDPGHPLAAYGQRLVISLGIDVRADETEWLQRGWFLIDSTTSDRDTITINGTGLLSLIDEARFVAPFEPSGTFEDTIRALVEPALTVEVDADLVNRNVPHGMHWDEDRIAALFEVLDAWPAKARVTEDGFLNVTPDDPPGASVLSLTDGVGGTVVDWQGEASRDGGFNAVVAKGQNSDGNEIQGVAYDTDPGSPLAHGGAFNPLTVPFGFSSPLLSTVDECRKAARTILNRKRSAASRKLAATIVPHPGLQIGDVVTVTGPGLTDAESVIERMTLPYTPSAMALTLRVL